MTEAPDECHELKSDYCSTCGDELDGKKQELICKRQVIEFLPIQAKYIEYQQYGCQCEGCGHHQKGTFPSGVNAPIQYGSIIIALVSYLSVYHYLPYQRMTQMFRDIYNLPISQGSVQNLLKSH